MRGMHWASHLCKSVSVHKDIVKMAMFGPGMQPGCLQATISSKDCADNGELALSAKLEQEAQIIISYQSCVIPLFLSIPLSRQESGPCHLQECRSNVCTDLNRNCLLPHDLPLELEHRHRRV